ncbi:MAG TPA: dipeptide/oligopeptide/nickel ABC transporter permease/ATP-binding protein [Woeseiaceae bacterium]|nr:dipeptide/oligopeptide/nickel ABC transporter permease/ATP-binding protein [Woeseiaceae bacterium]
MSAGLTLTWRRFSRNRLAVAGCLIVVLVAAASLAAPVLPLQDPNATHLADRILPPSSAGHLLGTDQLGRDILSRLVWGTRLSLAVAVSATLIAAVFGTLIGILAGYFRAIDNVLMRGIDMIMAFPYILLALSIVAVLGPGLFNALLAIAVINIPFFARSVRGATVSIVRLDYVDAARLSGLRDWRILAGEIFPNVLPVVIITMSTTVGWMILETAGLSFLGMGAQPPQADLGSMIGAGRDLLLIAPHVTAVPGAVIFVLVMGINLFGDGLRDLLDPKLRAGALLSPAPATEVDPALAAAAARGDEPAVANAPNLLEVRELRTWMMTGDAPVRACDDVSFAVRKGECLGLMGESGSGKSVTASSILRLVPSPPGRIVGGRILFQGDDLVTKPLDELNAVRGARISYIFQNPLSTLNPLFTAGEQVAEAVRRHRGLSRADAWNNAIELMDTVRIPDAAKRAADYPHQLSGGMRQRVGIAIALANDPDLVIADEPTTALDVTTQAEILKLLDELRRDRELAVLFISHDFAVIAALCERVIVMYAGRIVESGPTNALFRDPRHPYTRRLMACVPRLGEPGQVLEAIEGLPPPLDALPRGCNFADRCDYARGKCRARGIPLEVAPDGREVRCIRWQEIPG